MPQCYTSIVEKEIYQPNCSIAFGRSQVKKDSLSRLRELFYFSILYNLFQSFVLQNRYNALHIRYYQLHLRYK
nr:MAG TPA: hypothetical protein [Caudoviricetes sp.]